MNIHNIKKLIDYEILIIKHLLIIKTLIYINILIVIKKNNTNSSIELKIKC